MGNVAFQFLVGPPGCPSSALKSQGSPAGRCYGNYQQRCGKAVEENDSVPSTQ